MQKSKRFIVSVLILGAYLLSACSGATPVPSVVDDSSNGQLQEIVFTGTVESIGGEQWQISGQTISVEAVTAVDANVQVGDIVRVEANVSGDGSVVALKIESSSDDDSANANDSNSNDANANDDNANTNDNTNTADDNGNSNANSNDAPAGPEQEAFGVVEAITTDSITINGVTYALANFTEFNGIIAVGDQVKIHVIVNADGTLTIREIEKDDDNLNSNDNSNSNSNDDDSNSNNNDNSNDDDDDNSNDDNSNDDDDDNSNDDNSNDDDDSNSNDNGN